MFAALSLEIIGTIEYFNILCSDSRITPSSAVRLDLIGIVMLIVFDF